MDIGLTRVESDRKKSIDWRRLAPGLILVAIALSVIAGATVVAFYALSDDDRPVESVPYQLPATPHVPSDPAKITVTDPDQIKPVSARDAETQNAAIPLSPLPNPAARPLAVKAGDMQALSRGVDCLTTAVYYEAASEPLEGQRAVAQVVLNRVRHPSFPHTVCGVVYQGSGRSTGCQFSFTCDGSLARKPIPALWTRARMVAISALTGSVYAPVGLATYYHANYVLPYWAPTLTKLAIVGRHIFYRLPGGGGTPAAFSARYAGSEPDISAISAAAAALPLAQPAGTVAAPAVATPSSARPVLLPGTAGVGADGQPAGPPAPVAPVSTRWIMSADGHPIDGMPAPVPATPGKVTPPPIAATVAPDKKAPAIPAR